MKPVRALIVDDSPAAQSIARFALDDALEQLGEKMEITLVSGGVEALREITKGDIALLLCDLHMPDLHGFEVLHFWSKNRPDGSCAFIVTTKVSDHDRKKAEALGATGFLAKPLNTSALKESLSTLLENKSVPENS